MKRIPTDIQSAYLIVLAVESDGGENHMFARGDLDVSWVDFDSGDFGLAISFGLGSNVRFYVECSS
jgi:hypothetical protein